MEFNHINFHRDFFVLNLVDGRFLHFPYSGVHFLTTYENSKKLFIHIHDQGNYFHTYENYGQQAIDIDKIMDFRR